MEPVPSAGGNPRSQAWFPDPRLAGCSASRQPASWLGWIEIAIASLEILDFLSPIRAILIISHLGYRAHPRRRHPFLARIIQS
ncbi:hypothetical protein O181_069140 [Austropuccinia psidii MF-1]|uniref:Uncharacterized protein n=1 Tax=Austropuccinia psidii MF-1 TaxID=1389203 RepID=A0A9Q3ETW3_9BASI|nr:hypothetical protein [Austropuccinia psidii MF-1]